MNYLEKNVIKTYLIICCCVATLLAFFAFYTLSRIIIISVYDDGIQSVIYEMQLDAVNNSVGELYLVNGKTHFKWVKCDQK